jgi:hypothetical protein
MYMVTLVFIGARKIIMGALLFGPCKAHSAHTSHLGLRALRTHTTTPSFHQPTSHNSEHKQASTSNSLRKQQPRCRTKEPVSGKTTIALACTHLGQVSCSSSSSAYCSCSYSSLLLLLLLPSSLFVLVHRARKRSWRCRFADHTPLHILQSSKTPSANIRLTIAGSIASKPLGWEIAVRSSLFYAPTRSLPALSLPLPAAFVNCIPPIVARDVSSAASHSSAAHQSRQLHPPRGANLVNV